MIHVNNFVFLARDLNLTVFCMVINIPFYVQTEEAFNLVEVTISALSK